MPNAIPPNAIVGEDGNMTVNIHHFMDQLTRLMGR